MSEDKLGQGAPSTGTSETEEIIPGYTSVEQFTKEGFKILMEAIRHSNALPTGGDWNFYNISDSFKEIIHQEGNNVLRMINQIMQCNDIESNIRNKMLDDKTELVIDANDAILEKVANNIDEMNGIRKSVPEPIVIQTVQAELPINGSWNRLNTANIAVNSKSPQALGKNCIKLITAKNIIRPQKFFKDKIDNSNKYPWCPRITDKPNSLKPLAIFLEESEKGEEYSHPYEFELFRFVPTPEQLLEETPEFPKDISDTPLIEIDKPEQLNDLVETLRVCKEFGVDLEHHSYRSFMGITCLLQISTKDNDYLIDALALRDQLCVLNEVFTNNKIVKIFHGADKDIEWLQRDLAIYVVNMFDTHQAARVLEYSGLSLAYLMNRFCNVVPNKEFQLADWRIRPLPEEFKTYAREDTHYLIYLYKMLKKELLMKGNKSDNFLRSVIERSTQLCKKRYFKPVLRDDSHLEIYRKCKRLFDNRQLYALKELYAWRDNLAREEDESLGYVLPNHMLLQISETLPREMQGILACCNPIPPLVRSHLLELHQIILKARDQPLEKAILKEQTSGRGVLKKVSKVNVDSPLHCPHDLSKTNEFRDDLPTLLNLQELKAENVRVADLDLPIEKACSYSVFSCDENKLNERKTFKELRGFAYFSPYERYKLVKPFVAEKEKAQQARKEEESKEKEDETNDRSNEERIASIRDHFLTLSKKFSDELEAKKKLEEEEKQLEAKKKLEEEEKQKALIEMEGARKRKRDYDNDERESRPEFETNSFHTPTPKISSKFNNKKKGKKRKHDEIASQVPESSFEPQQFNKRKKKNAKRQNSQQKQQQRQQHEQQQEQEQQQNQQSKTPNRHLRFSPNQQNQQKAQNNQPSNKHKQNRRQTQENRNFVPYDYSSVDFRQFQGGAGSATSAIKIKPNFKAKNRKKMGKMGTKSSIFGNARKDRGRGRGTGHQ